jgi:general secretion pathway protein N
MRQEISIPLIASLIALLALAGVQWPKQEAQAVKSSPPAADARPVDPPSQLPLPQFSLPPLEEFSETLARPLFYEARQPPELSSTNGSDPQTPTRSVSTENVILSGIVLSGEEQFILVQDPSNQSLTRIEKGQEIGGWSLDDIRVDSVLLRKDDRTKVVPLWRFEPPPKQTVTRHAGKTAKQGSQQRRHQLLPRVQRRITRDGSQG